MMKKNRGLRTVCHVFCCNGHTQCNPVTSDGSTLLAATGKYEPQPLALLATPSNSSRRDPSK